jgi:hypothetical protein
MDQWVTVTNKKKTHQANPNHTSNNNGNRMEKQKTYLSSYVPKKHQSPATRTRNLSNSYNSYNSYSNNSAPVPVVYSKDHYYRKFMIVLFESTTKNLYVKYHATTIASILSDARCIVLNTDGYFTLTTRKAMMEILEPFQIKISPDWTLLYTPWGNLPFTNNIHIVPPANYGIIFGPILMDHLEKKLRLKTQLKTRTNEPSLGFPRVAALPLPNPKPLPPPPPSPSSSMPPNSPPNYKPIYQQSRPVCDEDIECVMCLDNEKSVVMVPCFHATMCAQCTNAMLKSPYMAKVCPICRSDIHNVIFVE